MKKEEKLIIAKAKFEVYTEVYERIEAILNGDIDMVEEYANDVFFLKGGFEQMVDELEFQIEDEKLDKKDSVKDFILSLESWKTLDEAESNIIKSIIKVERLEPISHSNSLHVFEERYEIDGDTFSLTSAIGGDGDEVTIQKLEK